MATLLSVPGQEMFGPGPWGPYTYATAADVASADVSAGTRPTRPGSPPQPIPRSRAQQQQQPFGGALSSWADYAELSASPASSDVTDHFLDASSEPASAASSFGADADGSLAMDDMPGRGLSRLSVTDALGAATHALAAATDASSSTATSAGPAAGACSQLAAQLQLQQERQQRQAAQTAASGLRQQLDDMSALLFRYRSKVPQQGTTGGISSNARPGLPALLQGVLAEAEAAVQRSAELAAGAASEAADAAHVARMVAGICARAALHADLGEQWGAERAALVRRLEQAARMGQAMLKHQKESSAEPEPWRQQLLNTALAVGCTCLGASTAVLIICRTQAH